MSETPFELVAICDTMAARNIVADHMRRDDLAATFLQGDAFTATGAGMARNPDRTVGPRARYRASESLAMTGGPAFGAACRVRRGAGREPRWPLSRRLTGA